MFEGRCNDANLIYKAACTIDGMHYISKTQNDMKSRIFKHITDVGKFWSKRQHLNHLVGLEVADIIGDAHSTVSAPATTNPATVLPPTSTPRSARSASRSKRNRASAQSKSQTPNSQSTNQHAAMNELLNLFSQDLHSSTPLASINEEDFDDAASALTTDDFSTMTPNQTDYLINSLTSQANQTTSPIIQIPSQTPTTPESQPNSPSYSVNAAFAAEFGGEETMQRLRDLENQRSQLFRPQLEDIYSKIQCSTLTRHLWSHCQGLIFEKKDNLFKWCRGELKVEVLHKGSAISMMKTAGSKNCTLCMQERINLFYEFGDKERCKNLINSKSELFGTCSCKARFLRFCAVGNEGADEASS
jgi:hypothetical protein